MNSNSTRGICDYSNYINFSFDIAFKVSDNVDEIHEDMIRIFCGISNEIANTLSITITAYSILYTLYYIDMKLIDLLNFALILDILKLIQILLFTQIQILI